MTESDRILWLHVYGSLRGHRLRGDTIQGTINRAAAKFFRKRPQRSFDPKTCSVRGEWLPLQQLTKAERFHDRVDPKREEGHAIVLLNAHGRTVVIDGHNRINKWEHNAKTELTWTITITLTGDPMTKNRPGVYRRGNVYWIKYSPKGRLQPFRVAGPWLLHVIPMSSHANTRSHQMANRQLAKLNQKQLAPTGTR
jgi:hypothetical protein